MKELNTSLRRIRIWEGKKCIMAIDLRGDEIITRPNKEGLKVTFESFEFPLYTTYKYNNERTKDN